MEMQILLKNKFTQLQSQNSRFSLRAFALKLDINPGVLSQILTGKRLISKKMAICFANKLNLTSAELESIISSYDNENNNAGLSYLELSEKQFNFVAEWEHLAVLSLLKTKNAKSNKEWIAKRLGITTDRAHDVIECLLGLGLIALRNKKWVRTYERFKTSDGILNSSIQQSHKENLKLASHALVNHPVDKRDFSHITMAINPLQMEKAIKLIREFQDQLSEVLEDGPSTEVYRFSCQLFSLTGDQK